MAATSRLTRTIGARTPQAMIVPWGLVSAHDSSTHGYGSRVVATLAARGRETSLIGLRLVRLAEGASETVGDDGEMCAVVLVGTVEVTVDGTSLGIAVRSGDVFDSLAEAVYVPPGQMLELRAVSDAVLALAAAPVSDRKAGRGRNDPAERPACAQRRHGQLVAHHSHPAGARRRGWTTIVGETINPPGNWSSYPPHKHDRHAPPEEVALEEVYFYRFKPESGFGVQLLYDDTGERAQIVRDGDVIVIPSGYHPVVAAPGYTLYYLGAHGGPGTCSGAYLDPWHAWIQTAEQ